MGRGVYRARRSNMPAQTPPRFRDVLRPITRTGPTGPTGPMRRAGRAGLLVVAMTSLAACDSTAEATASPGRTAAAATAAPQTFVARPRQHLLFTAKPSAPAAEVEGYFKARILPALARDRRVGDIATYVDARSGGYIIEVELRTASAAQLGLALDILSVG